MTFNLKDFAPALTARATIQGRATGADLPAVLAAEAGRVGPVGPWLCEHANECPAECRCPPDCYCKGKTCRESDPARPSPRWLLAIDPGCTDSAYVKLDLSNRKPFDFGKIPNADVLPMMGVSEAVHGPGHLAIEMVASYGMPVGAEVFDTCVWVGRFIQKWGDHHTRVYRKAVKLHLCGKLTANDSNIRQALIDLYGPTKAKAVGFKRAAGPLYGFAKDVWAAMAVAVTWADQHAPAPATPAARPSAREMAEWRPTLNREDER